MIPAMTRRKPALSILFCFLAAILSGCGADELTGHLERTILAVQIALPSVLATAEVDPGTINAVETYLTRVSEGVEASAEILQDETKKPSERGAAIAVLFSRAIAPELPPGTPTRVNIAVQAVAAAVQAFLSQVRTTAAYLELSRPELVFGFNGKAKQSKASKKRLAEVKRKAAQTRREIEATRRKPS